MKSKTKIEIVFPKRIVEIEGNYSNKEALLKEKSLQIGLSERDVFTFSGKGYVILDYGKEICGAGRIYTFTQATNFYPIFQQYCSIKFVSYPQILMAAEFTNSITVLS